MLQELSGSFEFHRLYMIALVIVAEIKPTVTIDELRQALCFKAFSDDDELDDESKRWRLRRHMF